jgi:hypothetical protein
MGQRHVGTPVDLGDPDRRDVLQAPDHLLDPEVPDDELLELEWRAEQGEKAIAVDVYRQRLLAHDAALDLLDATAFDLQIRSHGPFTPGHIVRVCGRPGQHAASGC